MRADNARKAPSTSSAYGAFYGDFQPQRPGAGVPAGADARVSRGSLAPSAAGFDGRAERSKSVDLSGGGLAIAGTSYTQPPSAAPPPSTVMMAEIGVPAVPMSSSEAFGVCSKEGALHENHDRGAAAILPDKATVLFACLDGHGAEGAAVSGYALRNLLAGCASALQAGKSASDAVHFAFARTSATMMQNVSDCRFSGSTAILTVLQNTEKGRILTTGWVGDSRAVVARQRGPPPAGGRGGQPPPQTPYMPVPLTKDHKPTDPKERARLAEARAIVRPSRVINPHTGAWLEVGAVRVWDASQIYGVAMSRSLGDMQVHPFLIPTPEVSSRLLDDKDKLLVLATDGVWDVMENDEAVAAGMSGRPLTACIEIVEACAKRWDTSMPGRRDDITSVVVDLTHPDLNVFGLPQQQQQQQMYAGGGGGSSSAWLPQVQ